MFCSHSVSNVIDKEKLDEILNILFFVLIPVSNITALVVFWVLAAALLVVDATGKPAWVIKYKMQPDKLPPVCI